MRRLRELDEDVSRLREEETVDPRVSFDSDIGRVPTRTDPDGTRWFSVRLFIQPKRGFDLHSIERVVYVLHPTFSPSQVAVLDPQNGFALEIESWGDFHAMAQVHFKAGETRTLVQYLPIGVKTAY